MGVKRTNKMKTMDRPVVSAEVSLARPLMASQTELDFSSQIVMADSIEEANESENDPQEDDEEDSDSQKG